ncbi:DUF2157 domain-containing protein [bacterium]|nr:DUF2157 domain-containing protein [bacterium]
MPNQKLTDYIRNSLAQGKSKEEIYKELLNQGWSIDAIQENFNTMVSKEEREDALKKTIRIIVIIGAILVGAGIFSFIAANWQEITKPVKIFIILAAMLISYAAGWHLKEKMNLPKSGEALILLGVIIYGAGIFLIAQMFHIRANWPDGFILWMIGTIAIAYVMESSPLFCLSILLGIIAVIGHPFGIFTSFRFNSFLLTSSFLLLAATITTFVTGWAMRKKMLPELKKFY